MLALTEAVSIARAIAVRSEQRIDGNQEFIGQGLANIVGSFFSSYASSGSFNRSGLNYEAGAKTPLAAVFAVRIPRRHPALGRAARGVSADRRHGGHPVPGGVGTDRFSPHLRHSHGQQVRDRHPRSPRSSPRCSWSWNSPFTSA